MAPSMIVVLLTAIITVSWTHIGIRSVRITIPGSLILLQNRSPSTRPATRTTRNLVITSNGTEPTKCLQFIGCTKEYRPVKVFYKDIFWNLPPFFYYFQNSIFVAFKGLDVGLLTSDIAHFFHKNEACQYQSNTYSTH